MPNLVLVLLVGAIAIQIPIGALMYVDAKRLGLENPEMYWLGVVVPRRRVRRATVLRLGAQKTPQNGRVVDQHRSGVDPYTGRPNAGAVGV